MSKGTNDLQTEADRSAQRCIIASLLNLYPNITVIGEEGKSDLNVPKDWLVTENCADFLAKNGNSCPDHLAGIQSEDIVVWVDPMDGTTEYTQGFLERVTVMIGIAFKDEPVGGVIHQPYFDGGNGSLGRTLWGVKGIGTGGFTTIIPPTSPPFIVTTTRTHSTELADSALAAMQATEIIRVGGAGYKVLQLLDGKAHAYLFASAGCKKWDTCAPEAILEAAGGVLTDITGVHYKYGGNVEFMNRVGVLATGPQQSHDEIVRRIPDKVKMELNKDSSRL